MAEIPEWLGKIIPAGAVVGRDAFHVPILPVLAEDTFEPGTHISVRPDGNGNWIAVDSTPHIGIIDPLLLENVQPGERFLLWIYPGTVTGLRHVYTHPALHIAPYYMAKNTHE